MKAPAAVAALSVVGSIAFAAGKIEDPLVRPRVSAASDTAGQALVSAAAATCQPASAASWFAPMFRTITPMPGCSPLIQSCQTPYAADVNSDGVMDYFMMFDLAVVSDSVPVTGCVLARSQMTVEASEAAESYDCILSASSVGASILQRYPGLVSAGLVPRGWRDMDADGDLDLIASVDCYYPKQNVLVPCWFENIGYEKPAPPIAADLNRDGHVDGADLGMLLAAWGPTR